MRTRQREMKADVRKYWAQKQRESRQRRIYALRPVKLTPASKLMIEQVIECAKTLARRKRDKWVRTSYLEAALNKLKGG